MPQEHSEFKHDFRSLDYTLVIGDDMKDSVGWASTCPDSATYVKYGNELFFFDPRFKDQDVINIYEDENIISGIDNLVVMIPGNRFNYTSRERKNMERLNKMITVGSNNRTIKWYKMESEFTQKNWALDFPYETFNKSGFLEKTDGETNIFNMIDFINGQGYLITIATKDFVSMQLTTSIRYTFHWFMYPKLHLNFKQPLDTELPIPFRKTKYDKLPFIMDPKYSEVDSYKAVLRDNKGFAEAFSRLTYKNIMINFHVLSRNFI